MKILALFIRSALTVVLFLATPVFAEKVTVTVTNVASGDGLVRGSLCSDSSKFPSTDCPYKADAPAKAGSVDLVFSDVAPGVCLHYLARY